MGKFVDLLLKKGRKDDIYKGLTDDDLKRRKSELQKQREFCDSVSMVDDRGYARDYNGKVTNRYREDAYQIQIRSIDREINRIDEELRRRKEQESSGYQPEVG